MVVLSHHHYLKNEYSLPPEVQPYLEAAHEAGNSEDYEMMLAEAENGLAILPGAPMLLNHKYAALMNLDRVDEAHTVLRQLAADHPDYLFARTAMAELCIDTGELDDALAWLDPLLTRQTFHHSEFRAMALTFFKYWSARGEVKGAKHWLNMLEEVNPDFVPAELIDMVDMLDELKDRLLQDEE